MSRRIATLIIIILLACTNGAAAQSRDDTFITLFAQSISTLSDAFPRTEGSVGERETFEYITSVFDEHGIETEVFDFDAFRGGHSFSQSVTAYIPGTLSDELVIAIPINHRTVPANTGDGTSRIAFGIALAASLSRASLPLSVRLAFLGAEYEDTSYSGGKLSVLERPGSFGFLSSEQNDAAPVQAYPMGTSQFLDAHLATGRAVVFYLDFDYTPERVTLRTGDSGYVSPYWLVESCSDALDAASVFYLIRGNETQFYRLGRSVNPSPLELYLEESIPGVSFHSGGSRLEGNDEIIWGARLYESITGFIESRSDGLDADWDRHYLFFQARSFSMIIRERSYIALVIIVLVMMIAYPLIAPLRFKNYLRSILRYFWAVPLLIALVMLLLFLGTLFVEGVSAIQGNPEIWTLRPAFFFGLKISAAIFLFALMFRYVKRIPFPRRGRFYNAVALFMLYADIVVLGLFDISLAYYVVWACIWAFLFSLSSSRIVKAVCLLASPAWFLKAAYDVFTVPEPSISRILILSRIEGNIILAILMLPFLCMLIRLDFMFRHPRRRTKRILMTVVYSSLGIVFGSLFVYLSLFVSYSDEQPQPVTATEYIDLSAESARLLVESPARLGTITVTGTENEETVRTPGRIVERELTYDPEVATITTNTSTFLGRGQITIEVDGIAAPEVVEMTIESENELVLYDANFPFSYDSFQRAVIHIGRNPALPLVARFTIPADQTGSVDVAIRYSDPADRVTVVGKDLQVARSLIVQNRFDIASLLSPGVYDDEYGDE